MPDSKNPLLADLVEEWLKAGNYGQAHAMAIGLFLRYISDLLGSVRINALSPEHIRDYQKFYSKIPVRAQVDKFTISQLAKMVGASKAAKTIKDHYGVISTFLSWCEGKAYPVNGSLNRVLTKGSGIKANDKNANKRVPFSDEELESLFNSKAYVETGEFKTSAMYLCALVDLFTGARMSEILQLERRDIYQEDKIWVIDFNDTSHDGIDPYKRLKRAGSHRVVPVHSQLIKLGFIDFVETKDKRIFDDEKRDGEGNFKDFPKRHSTYRKSVKVTKSKSKPEMKDFHSFRHTVITRLTDIKSVGRASQRFDVGIIDAIVGHESAARSEGEKTYNHSQQIKTKKQALERLEYPSIDFDKIIRWDKCSFYRKAYRETWQTPSGKSVTVRLDLN